MIDDELLRWVQSTVGASPETVLGLRDGSTPWLLRFPDGRDLVLRVAPEAHLVAVERAGLDLAARNGIDVPAVVAAAADNIPPLLLIEAVRGSSIIPTERPSERLGALGALAAQLHHIAVPPELGLPRRTRSIPDVDFAALRAQSAEQPLLRRAEAVVNEWRVSEPDGFVHGDLWQGNVMWDADRIAAVIDWDCAGFGPAGVDLGSLRCDAAVCFGVAAADDVLAGWERAAGRFAEHVPYWDVVAALSTPPEMGWFVGTIQSQGRGDLTQDVLVRRRDEFLAAALDRA